MQSPMRLIVFASFSWRLIAHVTLVQKTMTLRNVTATGPETTTTSRDIVMCEIYTDPHITGFDENENVPAGFRNVSSVKLLSSLSSAKSNVLDVYPEYFDVGDVWLIKSELLGVQGRIVSSSLTKAGGVVMVAVAIGGLSLDGNHVIVESRNGSVTWGTYTLSTGAFETQLSHGFVRILISGKEYNYVRNFERVEIHLPVNISFLINRFDEFLNIRITMAKDGALADGDVEGKCGYGNDIVNDDTLVETQRRKHDSGVAPRESMFT